MSDKSNIKTQCKDCVFYTLSSVSGERNQCLAGRLDKFIELDQATYENGSHTVNRLCNMCRNTQSIDKAYPGIRLSGDGETRIKKVLKKVRESVFPTVDFIILVNNDNQKQIRHSINSIKKLEALPTNIVFGITDNKVDAKTIYKLTRELEDIVKQVYVVHLFKKDPTQLEVIDNCFRKCKSFFVSLFECGYKIQPDLINQLDEMMNDHLMFVPLVTNSDGTINGETICRSFFELSMTYEGLKEFIRHQFKIQNIQEVVWNQK